MNEDQQAPEPTRDNEPRRPQRIRGVVIRKSRDELAERGVVIP